MKPTVALKLGRVSNLPTVWTNALVGVVLAQGGSMATMAHRSALPVSLTLLLCAALSLLYVGGMFLNDGFDRAYDAQMRPERPIPSGEISASTVFATGFGLLGGGVAMVTVADMTVGTGAPAALAAALLAGTIVVYNVWHKGNPLSPVVIAACRALVYVTTGLVIAAPLPASVITAAMVTFSYLIGLSYAAKQENLLRLEAWWPLAFLAAPLAYGALTAVSGDRPIGLGLVLWVALLVWIGHNVRRLLQGGPSIGRGVSGLLAGICLVDALMLAANGATGSALLAVCGFPLTLALQRYIPGT